jgi:hypothetical protein
LYNDSDSNACKIGRVDQIDQPISQQELEQEAKSNRWDHPVTCKHSFGSRKPSPSVDPNHFLRICIQAALPAQPHVTKTKVVSKVTPKVDLKFKPPMRLNTLNRPSNLTQVDQSKYFAKPTAGQPFNAPSTLLSSGLKRTKVESLSHGEIDKLTTGKEPKRFKPLLLKTLNSSPEVKPISQEVHQDRAFVCLYRKLKASKNSTWDGDGILCLEGSQRGPIAVLKDSAKRKVLGSTLLGRNPSLENGSVIQVGSREAEIQRPATESESLECENNSQETREADWTDIVKNEG